MVEPGKHPKVVTIGNDLDSLQKAVSIDCDYQGLIEIVGLETGVCIVCNEEGKLIGLEGNRRIGTDIIAGVFYVAGEDRWGNLISLNEHQVRAYSQRFWDPECFDQAEISSSMFSIFTIDW